ncbi:hypothetical protein GCM10014719_43730 [Planomonospora parontospora subsp. antibiotica]|nr:hypothetical protein GCM10014719_43730 [Planomonospora parontospora subsp. antibiotica]GII17532.1 hypothetical protein Ppa05_42580 [Planomonospora parontospora subsp. antibiotica]
MHRFSGSGTPPAARPGRSEAFVMRTTLGGGHPPVHTGRYRFHNTGLQGAALVYTSKADSANPSTCSFMTFILIRRSQTINIRRGIRTGGPSGPGTGKRGGRACHDPSATRRPPHW